MRKKIKLTVLIIHLAALIFLKETTFAAAPTSLQTTSIEAVKTIAVADGDYANGWQWVFAISLPSSDTFLKIKFNNFAGSSDDSVAANNIRFYSKQSANAYDASHAITITQADVFSQPLNLIPASTNGPSNRQIKIFVETRIPAGSAGGSYAAGYHIYAGTDRSIREIPPLMSSSSQDHLIGWKTSNFQAAPPSRIDNNKYDAVPIIGFFPSGKLFLIYYEGVGDALSGGLIKLQTSNNLGKTWSVAKTIISDPKYDILGTAGGATSSGRLIISYAQYKNKTSTFLDLRYIYSDDEGLTWSKPVQIPNDGMTAYQTYGRLIGIGNNNLLMSWYGRNATNHCVYAIKSGDNGTTWSKAVRVYCGTGAYSEASFVYLGKNRILGIMRNDGAMNPLQVLSLDNGATWSFSGNVNWESLPLAINCDLESYKTIDGKTMIVAYYQSRSDGYLKSITSTADDLITYGAKGWNLASKVSIASFIGASGYPSAIHPYGAPAAIGCYYSWLNPHHTTLDFFLSDFNVNTSVISGTVLAPVIPQLHFDLSESRIVNVAAFKKYLFPFPAIQNANIIGLDGSISLTSTGPDLAQFLAIIAYNPDGCPGNGEVYDSYKAIQQKYPNWKKLFPYIIKNSKIGTTTIPTIIRLVQKIPIKGCLFEILDGGDPASAAATTLTGNMKLIYDLGTVPANPPQLTSMDYEYIYGKNWGAPWTDYCTSGKCAFMAVYPKTTATTSILNLIGDVSSGAFTGSPYSDPPAGSWKARFDYYIYKGCKDLTPGYNGPADYYATIPADAKKIASIQLNGNGKQSINKPIKELSSPIFMNAGDCVVSLVNFISATGGSASLESQASYLSQPVKN